MELAGLVGELSPTEPADLRRASWLDAQLGSLSALARHAGGEEIAFVDLVEQLFDVRPEREPESTFEAAHAMISDALPGTGSLSSRLARHEATVVMPADRVIEAVETMTAVMRSATRAQLWLPDGESVSVVAARGVPYEAQTTYLGGRRSEVRVNLDLPVPLWMAVELASHECYPGHHAEAAVKDAVLGDSRPELRLPVELSPQATLSEGAATFAREVVMGDGELGHELRALARRLGMTVDVEAELVVQRARRLLDAVPPNATLAMHRDGLPVAAAREYLVEWGLIDGARLDAAAAGIRDPLQAGYAFAYPEGRRLVGEWLEVQGQTHGFGRLLAEQLTPALLRADLGEPPSLYPDSFA
jgi:hypothetical protein